jgi:RNA ligase
LTIWNYSEKCQYDGKWDEVTLMCRGLVTDNDGNIVARPFSKFFNWEENKHTPTEEFEVYKKEDGSLGILFHYNDEWILATRGSFTSDQAIKGREILKKYKYKYLPTDCTYLFEILYPENMIVVRYSNEELILLGSIQTDSGYEYDIHNEGYEELGFPIVKKYDGINDYSVLKSMVGDNEEGFVVKFSNGDRMKIKGQEYLRLHKIMTNLSTTAIWEVLSNGDSMDSILKDVPDEFYNKIKSYEKDLKYSYFSVSEYCGKMHDGFRYGKYNDKDPEPTKKEFAEFIVLNNIKPGFRSVMFAMWDKKPYDHIIWKLLKPEFKKL